MIGFFKSLGAGMALLFDFAGALRPRPRRLRRRSFRDDAEAVRGDWARIGQTLRRSTDEHRVQLKSRVGETR